jgi:hypothetical protein
MHWHSLPAARGCAVGRPRHRAAAHPPLRPPTLAYSPIFPPRSSRLLEPPEEVDARSRGSSRGWSPDRRGCPCSRGSRPQRRRRPLVAPHWSWAMLVVSLRLALCLNRRSLPIGNGCSDQHGFLAGASGVAVSMPPLAAGRSFPHRHRGERQGSARRSSSAAHLAKKEASKGVRCGLRRPYTRVCDSFH